jgi:hypothetical protein
VSGEKYDGNGSPDLEASGPDGRSDKPYEIMGKSTLTAENYPLRNPV